MATKTKNDPVSKIKDALITQKKLAQLSGINEVRLSRCLNREVDFTQEELDTIYKILRIN